MFEALRERISRKTRRTRADRAVIPRDALRSQAAGVRAGICALVVVTGQVSWTFAVHATLWSTCRRLTDVLG